MERMWVALTPKPFQFSELKQVLRYLQMCVHSVIMDHLRLAEQRTRREEVPLPETYAQSDPDPEREALDRLKRERLWELVGSRLHDDRERCVVYASYALGLKPRQILEQHEDLFDTIKDIYRTKENVLARLGRDESLREALLVA
jgi:DNA-directed RNA polymerase specialized sigma24 family protein